MGGRLTVWWFVECIREYPKTVHFFYDEEFKMFKAEIYTAQHISRDSDLIYEDTIRADNLNDLVFKAFKHFGPQAEISMRYDASNNGD